MFQEEEKEKYLECDVVIVGGGCAAYTAAIYCARAKLQTIVCPGDSSGQLEQAHTIENFPGFDTPIDGISLVKKMRTQAENQGAVVLDGQKVTSIGMGVFTNDTKIVSYSVIIATGASAKYLNLDNEDFYKGKGLSACAVCDSSLPIYRNQDLIVVGGGDSSVEESEYLSRFAKSVTIVVRGEKMRATKILQERIAKNAKINVLYNTEIFKYFGQDYLEGVILKDNKTGIFVSKQVAGVFMAIGHTPNTSFLKGCIKLDEEGYIVATNHVFTSKKGIFCAGDCVDRNYRQAITASSFGCMAALECIRMLQE